MVIIGGTGMCGHRMFLVLRESFENTFCTVRCNISEFPYCNYEFLRSNNVIKNVDVTNSDSILRLLYRLHPSVVINCAGIIPQHNQTSDKSEYIKVNSLVPHTLARWCSGNGSLLIHVSTDCVFDGRSGYYKETDQHSPVDVYGMSKSLGEPNDESTITLRTSFIGREIHHKMSLLEWALKQSGKSINGYCDHIYSGLTTTEFASVVSNIISNHISLRGLYHLASIPISKHDLLCIIKRAFNLNVEVLPYTSKHCDRSMCADKFKLATGYSAPDWNSMIDQIARSYHEDNDAVRNKT